ncbi:L-threonylcarbamoyladenylate synthase, partial [Streptomyces nigra]
GGRPRAGRRRRPDRGGLAARRGGVTQALLAELGEPLLSSTLLLPDEEEPLTQGWEIKDRLDHVLDGVVDSGECGTEPTTVIDFSSGEAEVVRAGAGDTSRFE